MNVFTAQSAKYCSAKQKEVSKNEEEEVQSWEEVDIRSTSES